MIKKIFKYIKKDIKSNYKFYIVLLLIVSLFCVKLDYTIYSPGSLISLEDRIIVKPSYESKGSMNLTYVTSRPATIMNILLSYVIPSWDIESLDDMRIDDESENEIIERNKIYLQDTSYDAIIAAFKEANLDYEIESINVTVTYVMNEAKTNIQVGDIIKSINGNSINDFNSLKEEISKYKENDTLVINVLRDNKIIECYSTLIKSDDKVLIGISLSELKTVKTTPSVEYIFKDNESGSSRGLMCALDIYNKITSYDITKGDIISGTGSIDENGIVGSIDGVKYKLKGAVNDNADVFIVPTDNYNEAIELKNKYNYDIEIIEADNLSNVINKLKER